MNVAQQKIAFFDALLEEYPKEEIGSFFNLLTETYLKMSRIDVALHPERELSVLEEKKFREAVSRLKEQEPIQYILGRTEFFGLTFMVDENVLIPRPETEELLAWILSDTKGQENLRILDIGTGSGCIAISLAKRMPAARVFGLDISPEALEVAKRNAAFNKVEVEFLEIDILKTEELPGNFDLIVSNPPYVRELEKEEMKNNVLQNEPELALYVENENPLLFYGKITKLAKAHLTKNGSLFFELNQYLAKETQTMVGEQGFKTSLRKDIFGNYRMLKAFMPR